MALSVGGLAKAVNFQIIPNRKPTAAICNVGCLIYAFSWRERENPASLRDDFIFADSTRHVVLGLISSVAPRPTKGILKIAPTINVEKPYFFFPPRPQMSQAAIRTKKTSHQR
jgi:hypothetical protein